MASRAAWTSGEFDPASFFGCEPEVVVFGGVGELGVDELNDVFAPCLAGLECSSSARLAVRLSRKGLDVGSTLHVRIGRLIRGDRVLREGLAVIFPDFVGLAPVASLLAFRGSGGGGSRSVVGVW